MTDSDESSIESPVAEIAPSAARRLASVTGMIALLTVSTYLFAPLEPLRPWKSDEGYVPFWNIIGRHFRGEGEQLAQSHARMEQLRKAHLTAPAPRPPPRRETPPVELRRASTFPAYEQEQEPGKARPLEVELENASALGHYFRRLTLVDLRVPGAIARASHWGDSLLGDDGLTFGIRSRLQAQFGDAGHGFHVLQPKNLFYLHRGIRFRVPTRWTTRCELLFNCEVDNRFGLGGVSTRSGGGSQSIFTTADGPPGDRVSRFELWHERSPIGGVFEVEIDKRRVERVDTRADERADDVAVFELEDGPHSISVRAVGGSVRGYGVVLERSGPGVVWENLAVIGIFTNTLNRQDADHIAGQIRKRNLDLLVFSMGGNDTQRGAGDIRQNYQAEYENALSRYRAGNPAASCLIIGVTAHGARTQYGDIRVRASVPEMVAVQRRVALDKGCAFFDLYQAMGGADSIAQWTASRPALMGGDLAHPTSEGHAVLASLVYEALMRGYADYRRRMAGKPLPELGKANPGPHAD